MVLVHLHAVQSTYLLNLLSTNSAGFESESFDSFWSWQQVRTAKFIREGWLVAGCLNGYIHVYSDTMEKVASFHAHDSAISSLDVHPTEPYIVSSSDKGLKLWNWENCQLIDSFETQHNIIEVKFNPTNADSCFAFTSCGLQIFEYESEECDQILLHGVNIVCSHPNFPILLTGSEKGNIHLWNSHTLRLEGKYNFYLGEVTAIACMKDSK
ncbi:hypothetical protein EJB05_53825, partial [Eragrostis curvula]